MLGPLAPTSPQHMRRMYSEQPPNPATLPGFSHHPPYQWGVLRWKNPGGAFRLSFRPHRYGLRCFRQEDAPFGQFRLPGLLPRCLLCGLSMGLPQPTWLCEATPEFLHRALRDVPDDFASCHLSLGRCDYRSSDTNRRRFRPCFRRASPRSTYHRPSWLRLEPSSS